MWHSILLLWHWWSTFCHNIPKCQSIVWLQFISQGLPKDFPSALMQQIVESELEAGTDCAADRADALDGAHFLLLPLCDADAWNLFFPSRVEMESDVSALHITTATWAAKPAANLSASDEKLEISFGRCASLKVLMQFWEGNIPEAEWSLVSWKVESVDVDQGKMTLIPCEGVARASIYIVIMRLIINGFRRLIAKLCDDDGILTHFRWGQIKRGFTCQSFSMILNAAAAPFCAQDTLILTGEFSNAHGSSAYAECYTVQSTRALQ